MAFLTLLSLLPGGGFFGDMEFVVRVFVFSYMVYWLYVNLRDAQILFGLGTVVAAFFIYVQPVATTILVVIFVIFITMGYHLQFLIQFGLYPLLRIFGVEMEHPEMAEQQKIHAIEQKLRQGLELDNEEEQFLDKVQKREADYQKKMQERMMRHYT